MHERIPIFCIIETPNEKINCKEITKKIDKPELYDQLKQNFDIDYWDILGVNYEDYQKFDWITDYEKFKVNNNLYNFREEKLEKARREIIKELKTLLTKTEELETITSYDWRYMQYNLYNPINHDKIVIIDTDGDIIFVGYLDDMPIIDTYAKYIDTIDYHW